MSAVAAQPPARAARPGGRVTQRRVVRSELTKLWSLRSTRWSLLLAVVTMAGLGVLIASVRIAHQGGQGGRRPIDPLDTSLAGWHLAELAIGVLGVLIISGEYSSGMIRSTLTAVPKRLPVLWAKLGVFGAATFALMLPCAFVAFYATQAVLAPHHLQTTLAHSHVLRAIVGAALFLTVTGLLGGALGALLRNTAGGIATFAGIMFVLPGDLGDPPGELVERDRPVPATQRRHRADEPHAGLRVARTLGGLRRLPRLRRRSHRGRGRAARAARRLSTSARGRPRRA